jgi:hypothetical protein
MANNCVYEDAVATTKTQKATEFRLKLELGAFSHPLLRAFTPQVTIVVLGKLIFLQAPLMP